jgi:3-dehydroquinate synthase
MAKRTAGDTDLTRVDVGDKDTYPVYIGTGSLNRLTDLLPGVGRQALVVTDRHVARRYLPRVSGALRDADLQVKSLVLPPGERTKSIRFLQRVLAKMVRSGMTRGSVVVALGGGVVGDLAGFAASVYMRGCPLVQIPTTLLAQVDSSVGGKTGINLKQGKNLAGSFYNPGLVLVDLQTLDTLPAREFNAGFAELLKYGLIFNEPLYRELESVLNRYPRGLKEALLADPGLLSRAVTRAVKIKAEIVTADMRENDLRMILNFGHTFGHAAEQLTRYRRFLHGEAVVLGMEMAVRLSALSGRLDREAAGQVVASLGRFPMPRVGGLRPRPMYRQMRRDKKMRDGRLTFILLDEVGTAVTETGVSRKQVLQSIRETLDNRAAIRRGRRG